MGLEKDYVQTLHFPQWTSKNALSRFLNKTRDGPFFEESLGIFDQSLLTFKDSSSVSSCTTNLFLISGSLSFFRSILAKSLVGQVIFLMDKHKRLRKIPPFSPLLHRIKHSNVGGATKFETFYSMINVDKRPQFSSIIRDISSYLDYSIRSAQSLPEGASFPINQYDQLHPNALHSKILVSSDFSCSGFGLRKLSQEELGTMYGLSSRFFSAVQHAEFSFVPVQIVRTLLICGLETREQKQSKRARQMVPLPQHIPDNAPTFLASLNRILPSAWYKCDGVSQKAAKNDDADIDFNKWDLRILSLWPHANALIPALRKLALRYQFRSLYREYRDYLATKFPIIYDDRLNRRITHYWGLFSNQLKGVLRPEVFSKLALFHVQSKIKKDKDQKQVHLFNTELDKGKSCLNNYLHSSFFSWDHGSTLLYWRWAHDEQIHARGDFPPCISNDLPTSLSKASVPKQPIFEKNYSKIKKALKRGYLNIAPDVKKVHNVIDYFGVEKGESDIRVVFNGTSCGLNGAVWAPNFWLPTAKSMVRALNFNFKSVDIDLGEMFLNFPLSQKLISYSGVDLTPFKMQLKNDKLAKNVNGKLVATWSRTWMGFRPSPEWACRFYYLAEEFVRGNEQDIKNPLYWKSIILNLIGNETYNPSLPNVYKWNDLVQNIAGEIKAYVDDLRVVGLSWEHAWTIARLVASRLQFLGIQDAPRKRRTDNGAWSGTIYHTSPSLIQTTVSVNKWLKGKSYIELLNNEIRDNPETDFEFKLLEQMRGYFCHLAMTYEILFPYLKGFHLTLCSHLPQRDEEGWKMSDLEWLGYMEERLSSGKVTQEQYSIEIHRIFDPSHQPKRVKPVKRFYKCLNALTKFFDQSNPPIITHRSTNIRLVAYGFVDASKGGFGASIDYGDFTRYRVGVWGADTDDESSNFREFANLVETLEEEHANSGALNNVTMIIATDNSTVEAALYKGNSSSPKLFDLIVRLRSLELKTGGKFIITHVSGNRMKKQGTDGISRGQLTEGISIGEYMLHFCPWNESALDRSKGLNTWIEATFGKECEFLNPSDWYTRAHDHCGGFKDKKGYWRVRIKPGTFVWTPPPAAADAALEELRKARLKRRKSTHFVFVPRLATTLWLKQLNKACDIVVYLPNHLPFWPSSMHEPLVLGICYPFLNHRPWQLRGSPKLFALGRQMRRLLEEPNVDARSVLLQLHSFCKRLPSLQKDLVWSLLHFKPRHQFSQSQDKRKKRKRNGEKQ